MLKGALWDKIKTEDSKESCFETRKLSLKFQETSIFNIHHLKGFRDTVYLSRKTTITIRMYNESIGQQHLHAQFKQS